MRSRGFLLFLTTVLLMAVVGPVRADIKTDRQDGLVVFTSRPERKPGVGTHTRPPNPGASQPPGDLMELITRASQKHGLNPELVASVVAVESAFNPRAVSPKGARGLMQLMPATAKEYGVSNVHDPRQNLAGGTAYLRDLIQRYQGDLRLALAAYNAGPGAVERAGGVPDYPETIGYLRRIENRFGPLEFDEAIDQKGSSSAIFSAGTIRPTTDSNGQIVWTNRRGKRTRVVGQR